MFLRRKWIILQLNIEVKKDISLDTIHDGRTLSTTAEHCPREHYPLTWGLDNNPFNRSSVGWIPDSFCLTVTSLVRAKSESNLVAVRFGTLEAPVSFVWSSSDSSRYCEFFEVASVSHAASNSGSWMNTEAAAVRSCCASRQIWKWRCEDAHRSHQHIHDHERLPIRKMASQFFDHKTAKWIPSLTS